MHKVLIVLISLVTCGCAYGQFDSSELTKDDIVSLYEVPIKEKPAYKFERKFNRESYIQFVVEESETEVGPWIVRQKIPYNLGVTTATIIFMVENENLSTPSGKAWLVSVRLGGMSGQRQGWTGSRFTIPAPGFEYTSRMETKEPSRLYTLKFKDRLFRFRLESSEKAFAL